MPIGIERGILFLEAELRVGRTGDLLTRKQSEALGRRRFRKALTYIAAGATIVQAAKKVQMSTSWLEKRLAEAKADANITVRLSRHRGHPDTPADHRSDADDLDGFYWEVNFPEPVAVRRKFA